MNKKKLFDIVMENAIKNLNNANFAFKISQRDVQEAEGRMKTRYDSIKTEAGFLADAQVKRIKILENELENLRQIKLPLSPQKAYLGTIITTTTENDSKYNDYFLLPGCGGLKISYETSSMTVITPSSPIGRLIFEKELNDEFNFNNKKYYIEHIE
jgi:transcription elongation GreA/GreB family factor